MAKKATYNTKNFQGMVTLKEWFHHVDGKSYMGFVGKITILNASELAGFELGKNEANWIARIENKSGEIALNLLGCQVRAISVCPKPKRIEMNYLDMDGF